MVKIKLCNYLILHKFYYIKYYFRKLTFIDLMSNFATPFN